MKFRDKGKGKGGEGLEKGGRKGWGRAGRWGDGGHGRGGDTSGLKGQKRRSVTHEMIAWVL
jgi:hypothetical protein